MARTMDNGRKKAFTKQEKVAHDLSLQYPVLNKRGTLFQAATHPSSSQLRKDPTDELAYSRGITEMQNASKPGRGTHGSQRS